MMEVICNCNPWAGKDWRIDPTIIWDDLTDDERAICFDWRQRGFHELSCLRWIEGRRYDPHQDQEFKREVHKALLKACFLHEQEPPSFSP